MNMRHLACVLTFIAIQGGAATLAQTAPPTVPDRMIVEQKRALVARILADAPIYDNIPAATSSEAKEKFARAERLYKRAEAQLESGQIAAADRSLNDAMRTVSKARTLVAGAVARANAEQMRHAELLQSVEVLEMSYQRNVERRSAWLAQVGDEDLKRVKILVNRARELASSGQFRDANMVLVKAQRDMISSYNNLLGAAPLLYDLRFGSAEEEYRYEIERGRAYEGLVPAAIQEYKPKSESVIAIDRLVEESRSLVTHARSHAEKKQFANAIQSQREAVAKLQQALEVAGVVVPQRIPN
jgi:hypothetical protein